MNQSIQKTFIALGWLLVTACANNPGVEYERLLEDRAAEAVAGVPAAVATGQPFVLEKGIKHEFEISDNDLIIDLEGQLSFYEVFQIHAKANERIRLTVYSFIKNRGLASYTVSPKVFIVSNSAELIDTTPLGRKMAVNLFGNYQYETKLMFIPSIEGDYKVLVASDNSRLDETISNSSQMTSVGTLFFPVTHGYRAHSTGKMAIEWQ